MDRGSLKRQIVSLLSDLDVIKKMPAGRTDRLTDTFNDCPEFFRNAVMAHPKKGTRDWRWARDFAVEGKVPQRKKRTPRVARVIEEITAEGVCVICENEGKHPDRPCVYAGQE